MSGGKISATLQPKLSHTLEDLIKFRIEVVFACDWT